MSEFIFKTHNLKRTLLIDDYIYYYYVHRLSKKFSMHQTVINIFLIFSGSRVKLKLTVYNRL